MSYVGAKPYPVRDGGTGQTTAPTNGQVLIGNSGRIRCIIAYGGKRN
jgi:hypothetical protein